MFVEEAGGGFGVCGAGLGEGGVEEEVWWDVRIMGGELGGVCAWDLFFWLGEEEGLTGKEEEGPCGAEEEERGFIGDGGGVGVCAVPGCYCCDVSFVWFLILVRWVGWRCWGYGRWEMGLTVAV